jgi:hypothetical protein
LADLTYAQQIWLSILDKLLLGGVVGVGGFTASWVLEHHRSRQTLRAEIARKTIEALSEVWTSLSLLEEASARYDDELLRSFLDELRTAGHPIPTPLPDAPEEMTRILRTFSDVTIPDDAHERVRARLTPRGEAMGKAHADLNEKLVRHRYWIGDEAVGALERYREDIYATYSESFITEEGLARRTAAIEALRATRDDVWRVLDRLFPSPVPRWSPPRVIALMKPLP